MTRHVGFEAFAVTGINPSMPLIAVSIPPLIFRSTPEKMHPVRDMDILGIPNFFDHAGNCMNGQAIAWGVLAGAAIIESRIPEDKKRPFIIGTSAVSSTLASGLNVAYEAGVKIPPLDKPENAPFDGQDALYGSVAGILLSAAFCYVGLRRLSQANRHSTANYTSTGKG